MTLAMQDSSHAITKLKPKIKVVHIFEPEIMKTDAANFRELVQLLTGKPTAAIGSEKRNKTKKKKKTLPRMINNGDSSLPRSNEVVDLTGGEQVKRELEEEERIPRMENNSGGFLGEFEAIDDFLQELSDFPLSPLSSSHLDVIGN